MHDQKREEICRRIALEQGADPDDVVATDRRDNEGYPIEMPIWMTLAESRLSTLPRGECASCDLNRGVAMVPPHDASPRCESGKRPHCTCDTCF